MGFNYERTADLALHSFGHRAESVMREVYKRWEPIDSGVNPTDPNNWELFTSLKTWPDRAMLEIAIFR